VKLRTQQQSGTTKLIGKEEASSALSRHVTPYEDHLVHSPDTRGLNKALYSGAPIKAHRAETPSKKEAYISSPPQAKLSMSRNSLSNKQAAAGAQNLTNDAPSMGKSVA